MSAGSPGREWVTRSESETVAAGRRLAAQLAPGAIVRLEGELGAGKTCFTRGLAQGLGADPTNVHSPSFSLVHLYRDRTGKSVLYHVDLYRIDGDADLREIGLEEVFASGVPVAVEWAERIPEGRFDPAPGDWRVRLEVVAPRHRRIGIEEAA